MSEVFNELLDRLIAGALKPKQTLGSAPVSAIACRSAYGGHRRQRSFWQFKLNESWTFCALRVLTDCWVLIYECVAAQQGAPADRAKNSAFVRRQSLRLACCPRDKGNTARSKVRLHNFPLVIATYDLEYTLSQTYCNGNGMYFPVSSSKPGLHAPPCSLFDEERKCGCIRSFNVAPDRLAGRRARSGLLPATASPRSGVRCQASLTEQIAVVASRSKSPGRSGTRIEAIFAIQLPHCAKRKVS